MDKLFPAQILKAAGALAPRVSLDQVRIKDASFSSSGDWEGVTSVDTGSLAHSIAPGTFTFNEKANTLDVEIAFTATLEGRKSKAPSFQMKAIYVARYHLTTTPPPVDMHELFFGSFAKSNALLNVWPYWREFASSCNDRMGLPHWNLPVLRLVPEPVEPKVDTKKSVAPARKPSAAKPVPSKSKK